MIQKPRGTRDFLPEEMEARRSTEAKMREAVRRWGYREVCTPEFEDLELFTLRSGEGIMQEMYVFEDKGGRKLALRPEITAAVIRMYINEAKVAPKPLRWCYFADCFRYERPQKGRYRQFWQFGAELIGADTAIADAEVIMLAADALNATGVTWDLKVGHLAFMKNLLKDLEPSAQRRVMAHLDKKDFDGLKATLTEMGKADLGESLTALVECRTLAGSLRDRRDDPGKRARGADDRYPRRIRCQLFPQLRDRPGPRLLYRAWSLKGLPTTSALRTRSWAAGRTGSRTCLAATMSLPWVLPSGLTG